MVLNEKAFTCKEFYQKLTCSRAPEFYENNELASMVIQLRHWYKEKGKKPPSIALFDLSRLEDIKDKNVILLRSYKAGPDGVEPQYVWAEVPAEYISQFIPCCKFTKKMDADGSIFITNEFGCEWCDGVGCDPNGKFCGECTNITKLKCLARGGKK